MIKHISYYKEGKRHIIQPNDRGLFTFKFVEGEGIMRKVKELALTATEFIKHPGIKDLDPTITLTDGNKLRVYHAGNSNIPIVHPTVVAEHYDKSRRDTRKTILEKKLESLKKNKEGEKDRKEETTQPMHPICPPYPGSKNKKSSVKVSSSPPQKKDSSDDPFGPYLDSWFGITDDEEDLNDGLQPDDYDYGYIDDDDGVW